MSYKVSVEFCMKWNYAPKAASLAESLFSKFRSDIQEMRLIPSQGGAFEVTVNGQKIYSKLETGTFPEHDRIISDMEKLNPFREESHER